MRIQHNFVYQVVSLNLSAFSPLCIGAWQRQVSFERMPVAKCLCWLEGGRKKYENNHGNRIEASCERRREKRAASSLPYSLASFQARQFPMRVNFVFFKKAAILFCKQKPLLRWLFAVHFPAASLSLLSSPLVKDKRLDDTICQLQLLCPKLLSLDQYIPSRKGGIEDKCLFTCHKTS